jgi:hypothetical protein
MYSSRVVCASDVFIRELFVVVQSIHLHQLSSFIAGNNLVSRDFIPSVVLGIFGTPKLVN